MAAKTGSKRGGMPARPEGGIDPTAVYTYEEAGGHLQMPWREVRDMVSEGVIGHVAINRRQRRILGRQLLEFLARREKGAWR